MRLLILPKDIDLTQDGMMTLNGTAIYQIAQTAGVEYDNSNGDDAYKESKRRVNEWFYHHMDEVPFHKLCYNTSIKTNDINTYLTDNSTTSVLAIDPHHGMTPLHILSMNPHAPADAIAALLAVNTETIFCEDNQGKTALDYAREYNVGGLLGMMNVLCNHRRASSEPSSLKRKRGTW